MAGAYGAEAAVAYNHWPGWVAAAAGSALAMVCMALTWYGWRMMPWPKLLERPADREGING